MSGDAGGPSELLLAEHFDNCLILVRQGASVQAALLNFPETARTLEPILETAQTVISLPPYPLAAGVSNSILANLLAQNAALIPPGSGTPPQSPPTAPPPPPHPIPGSISGLFFSTPFVILGATLGFVGLIALIMAIIFGGATGSSELTSTPNPTFAPASIIAFTRTATATPTVGNGPTTVTTTTSTAGSTPAPTLPSIGAEVEIEGPITYINVINNLTVVVVNNTEFVLNPDVVQAYGPRLSIGLVLKFKTKRIENGQFIIITIITINGTPVTQPTTTQPSLITPAPPPKSGGDDDEDKGKPKKDKPDDKENGDGKGKKK